MTIDIEKFSLLFRSILLFEHIVHFKKVQLISMADDRYFVRMN